MFQIAFVIGAFSYLIFFLGITGLLYKNIIISVTLSFFILLFFLIRQKLKFLLKPSKFSAISKILALLLLLQIVINFIGALGPEISFDALWYHLTLPKLFLATHKIFHIPGGLLYYSDMPKLTEMLYVIGLSFGNEILPKVIHFGFGLLTVFAIFNLSKKILDQKLSLLAALIFYSSLVVGWESISAYVDLARAFFEIMALWAFINWYEKDNMKNLSILGFMIGFSIAVKLVSISSLIIFLALLLLKLFENKGNVSNSIKSVFVLLVFAFIPVIPWLFFSFLNTGNLFYPYFSNLSIDSGSIFSYPNLINFPKELYVMFLNLNDPIAPTFLIFLPVILIKIRKFDKRIKFASAYVFISFAFWFFTQQERGGRFLLPFLPAYSIIIAYAIHLVKDKLIIKISYLIIILVSVVSIVYRGVANSKFVPVILGYESKQKFLTNHLNFSFGDFYDTDGYFKMRIQSSDKVLLYGFHNLYYVDFPFIDSTFVKKGDKFNYIAVQNAKIPKHFSTWNEIYYNDKTHVKLYSLGGREWTY